MSAYWCVEGLYASAKEINSACHPVERKKKLGIIISS